MTTRVDFMGVSVAAKVFSKMGAWRDFDLVQPLPDGGYVTVPKEVVGE